ncbi:MAG: DEAD/DEAH box helicase [Myxococcales bacterium]|nr:DEAD/DEAH box helicase [Myxococcales bacterium]
MEEQQAVEELFEAVREECAKPVWSRGQHLAKTGTVNGKRTHNDEIEVQITTRGGMVTPLVVLSPDHRDWSCDCESDDDACIHAAAAVIAIRNSLREGTGIPGIEVPTAKVGYRLTRNGRSLAIARVLLRGNQEIPLTTRLTVATQQERNDDIAASQADMAADVVLGPLSAGRIPRPLMTRLLAALQNCTDVTLEGRRVRVESPRPVLHACVQDHAEGFCVVAEQNPEITEIFDNGAVVHAGALRAVGELDLSPRDIEELRKGRVFPFGNVADLVGRVLPALEERLPVKVDSKLLPSAVSMQPRLVVNTDFDGDALTILPTLVYGDPPAARVDGGKLHYLEGPLPLRNERKEKRLVEQLQAELDLTPGVAQRYYGLGAVHMAGRVNGFGLATVEGEGLSSCFVAAPLEARFDPAAAGFGLQFRSGGGDGDDEVRHASPEAVVRAWERGESLVPLVEGGWAPLPEAVMQRCGDLLADLLAAKGDSGTLPRAALPDLARLCEALDAPPPPEFDRLRALVGDFSGIPDAILPTDLRARLRDYQRLGVNWLAFLSDADLGAMLADDMGLGKTLQALCAIGAPALVVAPASVLHNWAEEIRRFRPALSINTYHGPQRTLDDGADVTLTTYTILRIDAAILADRGWDTIVLDEAQNIKNADSQVAQAAFGLNGRFRITLSGTPVENRLEELWSQFHFINPGLLGGRRDFQDRYARPIADGDELAIKRLRTRIRPFLLRREKDVVAQELPPRTDMVARCTLGEREREMYDALRAATRKEVLEQLQAGGSVMAALEALLRLRQAACHVGLLPGQQAESSAKLELMLEMLDNVVAEDHKALVFSQWTSMLDLIEPHLSTAGIPYARLDGSTRDRGAVVASFQSPDGPPVMLISLRAGGTGLNLTAADNVFLVDPWWNPAVEDQAADRAHRIGQDRPVLVHRLVASDTVEERMLELQQRKRALAAAATGDAGQVGGLTRDDLLALLG